MKAKSRLKSGSSSSVSPPAGPLIQTTESLPQIPQTFSPHPFQHTIPRVQLGNLKGLGNYFQHVPTLLLSLPFYVGVFLILQKIPPHNLKNFLIPNLYLPFQVAVFLGNFFLLSFICLNSRRGLLLSLLIQTFIFFKLQSVVLSFPLVIGTLGVFVIIEILFLIVKKIKTHDSTPRNRHRLPPAPRRT